MDHLMSQGAIEIPLIRESFLIGYYYPVLRWTIVCLISVISCYRAQPFPIIQRFVKSLAAELNRGFHRPIDGILKLCVLFGTFVLKIGLSDIEDIVVTHRILTYPFLPLITWKLAKVIFTYLLTILLIPFSEPYDRKSSSDPSERRHLV